MRVGERHLPLPVRIVGGGRAYEINRPIHHEWNAIGGSDRERFDAHIGNVDFALHRVDDPHADIDGISNRLLVTVEIAEGHRGFLNAENDPVGLLDLLECSREFAGVCGRGDQGNSKQGQWQAHHGEPHRIVNRFAATELMAVVSINRGRS